MSGARVTQSNIPPANRGRDVFLLGLAPMERRYPWRQTGPAGYRRSLTWSAAGTGISAADEPGHRHAHLSTIGI